MIIARRGWRLETVLALRCMGFSLLALALAWGLLALSGLVEGVRFGIGAALRLSLSESLPLLLPLAPLLVATGASLAAARTRGLGEEQAMLALGLDPRRSAIRAGLVALGLALALQLAQLSLSPGLAARALDLREELGDARRGSDWIWDGQAAVALIDGRRVQAEQGRLSVLGPGDPAALADAQARARSLRLPFAARAVDLRASVAPMRAERALRLSAIPAAFALGLLGWRGLGPLSPLVTGPVLGLAWQALSLLLAGLAALGHLPPSSMVGAALGGTVAVLALARRA